MKDSKSSQLCIVWMYLRSWGPSACHNLLDTMTLFINEQDYNTAIMSIMTGPDENATEGRGPNLTVL